MERLNTAFEKMKSDGRVGLMAHLVAGYPSVRATEELLEGIASVGVDILELQIPFSDPIADGPTIIRASDSSLKNGTKLEDCFRIAESFRRKNTHTPLLFMGYANTLVNRGIPEFLREAKHYGGDGCIIPDLSPDEEEGVSYLRSSKKEKIASVLILSPTSSRERMKKIADFGSGFFYCVARTGVTGKETRFTQELSQFLSRCRAVTSLPIAVGFGVSKPEHVRFLHGKADAAIVGSETLRVFDRSGIKGVLRFLETMRDAGKTRPGP